MKKLILSAAMAALCLSASAADQFIHFKKNAGDFTLFANGTPAVS